MTNPQSVTLNGEKLERFPLRSRKARMSTVNTVNILLEILARALMQEKKYQRRDSERVKLSYFSVDMILYIEEPKTPQRDYWNSQKIW